MTTHFIQGRPASSLPCELGFSEVLNLAHLEPNEDLFFMYLAHSSMKILTFEFSCSMKMLLYKRRTLSPTLLDYLGLFLSCCLWWAKERLSGLLLPCQSPIASEETPIKVLGPPILVLETELNEAFKISVAKKKKGWKEKNCNRGTRRLPRMWSWEREWEILWRPVRWAAPETQVRFRWHQSLCCGGFPLSSPTCPLCPRGLSLAFLLKLVFLWYKVMHSCGFRYANELPEGETCGAGGD